MRRIRIISPEKHEHNNLWIVFVVTSVLLLTGLIIFLTVSNGQPDIAFYTLRDLLNQLKRNGDFGGFFACLLLLGAIGIGPFVSLAAIFYYSRKIKAHPCFTHIDLSNTSLTLENSNPALSFSSPYDALSCTLSVTTYIHKGLRGAEHRCIDNITLTFATAEKNPLIIKHVGALTFVRKILDIAPRFASFSYEVRSLHGAYSEEEKDLAQYVKDQIANYQIYGKMLRYSDLQRKQVRLTGYMMMGVGVLFAFLVQDFFLDLWRDRADSFSRFLLCLLIGALLIIFLPAVRMCYLAHQDAKFAKQLAAKQNR